MGPSETKKRLRGGRCPGGEQVLRLRAGDGAFRAPARVTFFFCKKKVTKENHLDLRSKDPLARYGLCKIGGADLAELARRGTLSVRGIACTACAAAADSSEGRGGVLDGLGDYQIAPKPPGGRLWLVAANAAVVWGRRLRAGRGTRDTSSVTASPCHLSLCGSVGSRV